MTACIVHNSVHKNTAHAPAFPPPKIGANYSKKKSLYWLLYKNMKFVEELWTYSPGPEDKDALEYNRTVSKYAPWYIYTILQSWFNQAE